ncbi:hypothetical protein [Streptomyces purpurascens]
MPRLSGDLIVAACRTLPLGLVAAAGGTGLLMAALSRTTGEAGEWLALPLLRVAILAFAMGLVFLLDDPARHTTATVPTPRPVRIALRVGLVAPVVAAWWTAALLLVPRDLRPPVADITLEAGLGLRAGGGRRGGRGAPQRHRTARAAARGRPVDLGDAGPAVLARAVGAVRAGAGRAVGGGA